MIKTKLNSRTLFLRVTLKIFTTIAVLWVITILTAGLFESPDSDSASSHEFELSKLAENSALYFKINRRELLVIKQPKQLAVFWAQDPIYGCRLEYINHVIKPVCIDIKYNLNGWSEDKNQQLLAPEYKITQTNKLVIY